MRRWALHTTYVTNANVRKNKFLVPKTLPQSNGKSVKLLVNVLKVESKRKQGVLCKFVLEN